MRSILIFCIGWFVLVGFETWNDKTLRVTIKEGSHFYIKGTSNVNTFACHYQKSIKPQSFVLSYQDHKKGWLLENTKLAFGSDAFDCGGRRINKDFKDLINAEAFKFIEIEVCEIQPKGQDLEAVLEVSIAGATQFMTVTVSKDKSTSELTSVLKLDIEDFNLETPSKMMGLIKVHQEIEVHVNLLLDIDA